jgi:hypothetical protein
MTIPKIAVLATGLAGAVMVATINPPPAQALPSYKLACTGCHGAVTTGVSTAVPSKTVLAAGASYTVRITLAAGGQGLTGYWISGPGGVSGGPSSALAYTATLKAPATAGLKTYRVWTRQGNRVGSVAYHVTVSAPVSPIQFGRIQYNAPGTDLATKVSINREYVVIQNRGTVAKSLTGWTVSSLRTSSTDCLASACTITRALGFRRTNAAHTIPVSCRIFMVHLLDNSFQASLL